MTPSDPEQPAAAHGAPPILAGGGPSLGERASTRTSSITVLLGIVGIALFGFCILSGVALGLRWGRKASARESPPASAPVSVVGQAPAAQPEEWPWATVTPGRFPTAVLRAGPGTNTAVVDTLPSGMRVQRGRTARGPDQKSTGTWYQVRANVRGKVLCGWMHEDVLR